MRVLIVHNEYQYAGGEDVVVQQDAKMLEKHGHQVFFYRRNNDELKHYTKLQKLLLPIKTCFSVKSYSEIRSLIQKEQIDVVHVHNTLPLISYSCYYAAKKEQVKLVQTIHNFRLVCPNALFYREHHICEECLSKGLLQGVKYGCYRNSKTQTLVVVMALKLHRILKTFDLPNAYIALTQFNKEKLTTLINPDKIHIKSNYLNFTLPEQSVQQEDIYSYYVYAARLERVKGIFVLLEAFRNLPEQKLFILGTGPDEEEVKTYIVKHQMTNVFYKGFTPHEEVISYMSKAKAVIYPSLWYEGFPMTVVESLACGTPVIASDTPNMAEKIQAHYNGYTFNTGDAEKLCQVVSWIEKIDVQMYMELRKNAKDTYENNFTEQIVYQKLMNIYEM